MPKSLNIKRYFKILNNISLRHYEVEIRRHALVRAMQRGIGPEMVEATILGGKIKRFGKSNIKFIKRYKRFSVICIAEVTGLRIKVLTIETKK